MAAVARFAASAWLGGIDSDAGADLERFVVAVERILADSFHDGRELVPKNQRRVDARVADAPIRVRMQVAAADAGDQHAQQDTFGTGPTRVRHAFAAQIARAMKSRRQHG
jgi:hypothetical protein